MQTLEMRRSPTDAVWQSRHEPAIEIISVCCHCNAIKHTEDNWGPELLKHAGVNQRVSHGICPECAGREYPGFDLYE